MLMTAPFVWDEHSQPYNYARYSSFGLKFILEKHGFEILEQVLIKYFRKMKTYVSIMRL